MIANWRYVVPVPHYILGTPIRVHLLKIIMHLTTLVLVMAVVV